MQWIWIIAGLMMLLAATVLTWLLRRRSTAHFSRMEPYRKLPRLIHKTACLPYDTQDIAALRAHTLELLEAILRLNQRLLALPRLPASTEGEPRLMDLARDIVDDGQYTPDAMLKALGTLEKPAASTEISALPDCICAAQCQRLALVVRTIYENAQQRQRANRLVRRLLRSRKPYALLDKAGLNSVGLSALAKAMHQQEQPEAIVLLERWLDVHEITTEALTQQDHFRQLQMAEEIRRAANCFRSMQDLPWLEQCEQADALHALLMNDPSGTYPCMDAASRQQLRHRAEALSRHTKVDAAEIIRHALLLCEDAEPRTLERYIGYWLQDRHGLRTLRRSLPTGKGRLYTRFAADHGALRYLLLWGFGAFSGFCFLQSGQPVLMLPFFLVVSGDVIRLAVHRIKETPLPRMLPEHIPHHVRTLVVLPALLHDQHEAIHMVRRLLTASRAFPQDGVDYLLLGNFAPSMTAISAADGPIMEAAVSAAAALGSKLSLHYMQRGRVWDGDRHTYCARGGRHGAIIELLRLIVQGECADMLACSTLEPSSLERRYDYAFVLSPHKEFCPGTLQQLLQTISHPLFERFPTSQGWRGYSVLSAGASSCFDGVGLIRPAACLEAIDGVLDPSLDADVLLGELAGHADVGLDIAPSMNDLSWPDLLDESRRAWRLFPWQLPWVRTPSGIINNPLRQSSRFRLRELLRRTLLPLCQFALLLWAVLTQNWLLFLFALVSPEIRHFQLRRSAFFHMLCRLSLLPTRALTTLLPIWDALRRKRSSTDVTPSAEVWMQGVSATLYAALGVIIPGMGVPALLLSVGFACFPLAHRFLEAPILPEEGLTNSQLLLLEDTAASTWRYFCQQADASPLPPDSIQYEPGHITAETTSPEAIAAYLLSCVCAKDLGFVTATGAAARLQRTLAALKDLPMLLGLPCRSYTLPALTVSDAQVSASSVGLLAAALMTSAQALREWLPELPPAFADLSAEAEAILSNWNPSVLYDASTGLFYAALDEDSQPTGHIRTLADDGLLMLLTTCARKQAPPDCLSRLSRTRVRIGKQEIPLSRRGTAAEHLLAGLFLPIDEQEARAFITAMQQQGMNGVFGQGMCCIWQFDAALRYRRKTIGIPGAALELGSYLPVYAPYAAALALPFQPKAAAESLTQIAALGAKGPNGFCDAVDFSNGVALVGLHNTFHQGVILAAAAHCLADAPLRRYFCALPEVEACLPLLNTKPPVLTLPQLPATGLSTADENPAPLNIDALLHPAPLTLLGTSDFHLLADAHGGLQLFDHALPLTTALHFYLRDEGRTYRLGDPHLQGETTFAAGEFRCEQLCGSLRSEITHCADTLHHRALTVVTITNLSARDRMIELADCLLPGLSAPAGTLECAAPEAQHLTIRARGTDAVLHHTMDASILPLATAICTDPSLFTGRTGTMQQPASLEQHPQDILAQSVKPCLSFRGRFALGGRGQITVWYTTSLIDQPAPLLTELPGVRRLAAMQALAISASAGMALPHPEITSLLSTLLQQSDWKVSLLMTDDDSALPDLLTALAWVRHHGQQVSLRIHCGQTVKDRLSSTHTADFATFASPDDAHYPLVFTGEEPLLTQLERFFTHLPAPKPNRTPIPAKLPTMTLLHPGSYGGFDPDTLDYILQLEPGQLPPVPWENLHRTRHFQESADETGLHVPFAEDVQIRMEDNTVLSPWSTALPRSIRMRPGETDWEAWSDQLDVRLRASCLPGHTCALRSLHIHNAAHAPLRLHICVTADLDAAPLVCMPGIVMTEQPAQRKQAFLAGDGWEAHVSHDAHAELSCNIVLEPQRSGRLVWLSGFARHGEDVERALRTLRENSVSHLLRKVQTPLADILTTISFASPEPTFDLMMNRILPLQALHASGASGVPALMYISPEEARRALLHQARQPMSRDEWAHFILLASHYIRVTGDTAMLQANLPVQGATILQCCRNAILSVPLTHQHLPQGDDQPRRCFLYAMAAQALDKLNPDPEAADLARRLLNAADTYLWQDSYYGEPLRLDVQTLASAAYGANPRTRQAISICWTALYDEMHGLIRMQEPTDAAPLPGLPENGGMITLEVVRCLRALLRSGLTNEAHELLRALNPLHHTDTPERQAVFREAPWQLPGGMYAAPMAPGRAVPGGEEAAALLYAVILEDVLGVQLQHNALRLKPSVPADWEDFTLTWRVGTSTWHISAERRARALTIDGEEASVDEITLADDGKVHQVRIPLA